MKGPRGYAGPVVHYWQHSLDYIGFGTDWRLEGLMRGFLRLYQKTRSMRFKELAVECGRFALNNQMPDGGFACSSFEANPSFGRNGTPHESAVCIALLELASELEKERKGDGKAFAMAAYRNLEGIHIQKMWSEKHRTFFQFDKKIAIRQPNALVPNKIATACQAFFAMYRYTKDRDFLKRGLTALEFVPSLQYIQEGECFGGIFQANTAKELFSFYTARCIPALVEAFELTKNPIWEESIRNAVIFLKTMQNEDGSFDAAYMDFGNGLQRTPFPRFIAGAGDIVRALEMAEPFIKNDSRRTEEWILKNQGPSGGFFSALGLEHKNKTSVPEKIHAEWQDLLPVVGWNDKVFSFLAERLEEGETIEETEFVDSELPAANGTLREEKDRFVVMEPGRTRIFEKNALFAAPYRTLKGLFFTIGLQEIPLSDWIARAGLRTLRN